MHARSILIAVVLLSFAASGTAAEPPQVSFDVGPVIACRTVPSAEAAMAEPDEKIIEAKFRVSTLITAGDANDVDELLIVIASPEGRLRVVDFRPKTRMVSDVEGPIETLQTEDVSRSIDAHLGGVASAGQGIVDLQLKPSFGGGTTKSNSMKETLKRRAPKSLKVAAGTVHGRTGVFFKLKPDTQSTLEGAKDYCCRFAVPQDWRTDRAVISCFARTESKQYFVTRTHLCGSAEFPVGLYLEGDVEARQQAGSIVEGPKPPSGGRLSRFFEASLELIKDQICCSP